MVYSEKILLNNLQIKKIEINYIYTVHYYSLINQSYNQSIMEHYCKQCEKHIESKYQNEFWIYCPRCGKKLVLQKSKISNYILFVNSLRTYNYYKKFFLNFEAQDCYIRSERLGYIFREEDIDKSEINTEKIIIPQDEKLVVVDIISPLLGPEEMENRSKNFCSDYPNAIYIFIRENKMSKCTINKNTTFDIFNGYYVFTSSD